MHSPEAASSRTPVQEGYDSHESESRNGTFDANQLHEAHAADLAKGWGSEEFYAATAQTEAMIGFEYSNVEEYHEQREKFLEGVGEQITERLGAKLTEVSESLAQFIAEQTGENAETIAAELGSRLEGVGFGGFYDYTETENEKKPYDTNPRNAGEFDLGSREIVLGAQTFFARLKNNNMDLEATVNELMDSTIEHEAIHALFKSSRFTEEKEDWRPTAQNGVMVDLDYEVANDETGETKEILQTYAAWANEALIELTRMRVFDRDWEDLSYKREAFTLLVLEQLDTEQRGSADGNLISDGIVSATQGYPAELFGKIEMITGHPGAISELRNALMLADANEVSSEDLADNIRSNLSQREEAPDTSDMEPEEAARILARWEEIAATTSPSTYNEQLTTAAQHTSEAYPITDGEAMLTRSILGSIASTINDRSSPGRRRGTPPKKNLSPNRVTKRSVSTNKGRFSRDT